MRGEGVNYIIWFKTGRRAVVNVVKEPSGRIKRREFID